MQESIKFLPMVKEFIRKNMPMGGYKIVSKRLSEAGITLNNREILSEIRSLNNCPNMKVVIECCQFLNDNSIALDDYCKDLLNTIK